jgi:hypothetical protein
MEEMRNAYNILVDKLKEKSPLGRRCRKREENVRMDELRMGGCGLDSSGSV